MLWYLLYPHNNFYEVSLQVYQMSYRGAQFFVHVQLGAVVKFICKSGFSLKFIVEIQQGIHPKDFPFKHVTCSKYAFVMFVMWQHQSFQAKKNLSFYGIC